MSPDTPPRRFVLKSTPESRAAGAVSGLAIVLTLAATAVCWWAAATRADLSVLLLTSVLLAFFVLLRSDASVARGSEMFVRYIDEETPPGNVALAALVVASATAAGAATWAIAPWLLSGQDGGVLFGRAALLGGGALAVGFAVGVFFTWHYTVLFAPAGSAMAATAVAGAQNGALAAGGIVVGSLLLIITAGIIGNNRKNTGLRFALTIPFTIFPLLVLGAAVAIGVALRALAVRCYATARYPVRGVTCFADNWTRLVLGTDLATPPELVPGLPEDHRLYFNFSWSNLFAKRSLDDWILIALRWPFLYLPSILYRLYLKSTAWLYFPLIWLARVPPAHRDDGGALVWDPARGRALVDRIGFGVALAVAAAVGWTLFDAAAVARGVAVVAEKTGLPIHPLLMVAGLDLGRAHPLTGMTGGAALLGVVGYLWTDAIQTRVEKVPGHVPSALNMRALLLTGNLCTMLTAAALMVGVYELVLALHLDCRLPHAVGAGLAPVLGPAVCPGG